MELKVRRDRVPFVEWANELVVSGLAKAVLAGARAKASPNRASMIAGTRPETGWAIHGQGEGHRKVTGGPNPLVSQD